VDHGRSRLFGVEEKRRHKQDRITCADVEVDVVHDEAQIASVVLRHTGNCFDHIAQISERGTHGVKVAIFRFRAFVAAEFEHINCCRVAPHVFRTERQEARIWVGRAGVRCATLDKPLRLPIRAHVLVPTSADLVLCGVQTLALLATVQDQVTIGTRNPVGLVRTLKTFGDVCTHRRTEKVGGYSTRI
jgi:hypothetical protein